MKELGHIYSSNVNGAVIFKMDSKSSHSIHYSNCSSYESREIPGDIGTEIDEPHFGD